MLLQTALDQAGPGEPVKLVTNHPATSVDCERGIITFEDGSTVQVDLLIGADGVNVSVKSACASRELPDSVAFVSSPIPDKPSESRRRRSRLTLHAIAATLRLKRSRN